MGWTVHSYSAYYDYQMNAVPSLIFNEGRRCETAPADHLMTIEYGTKRMTTCMSHKSSRALHYSRDCAGLEHDARVPLSEDLIGPW